MARVISLQRRELRDDLPAPEPADAAEVMAAAAVRARRGIFGVMATVIARDGSAPSTPGQKLYVGSDNACLGTVGGGAVEREALGACLDLLGQAAPMHSTRTFRLGAELGMCCGGSATVLFEPIATRRPCLIIGAGHVSRATAPLLAKVGFAVTVVDDRQAWGGPSDESVTRISGEFDDVIMPRNAVVIVMTHDHALDQRAIEWALGKGFAYVGGIGSRAKARRTRDRLEHKGFPAEDVARVRMPIGVAVGARLPDEIAVAIAAELVAWRRQGE
jgi:xanthine dehydrogenase accessory factor